jgi:nucleotide-binding universal stress UspA family protein
VSIFPTAILLAPDGSEKADLTAQTAADVAERTGSELHVAHVVHLPPMTSDLSYMAARSHEEAYEEAEQEARRLLDEQVRTLDEGGGNVAGAHLRTGQPDEEVVRLGEELDAGLVAVGSRGLDAIKRALMGSVSDSVVRHAHCSVLVVRNEKRSAKRSRR